MKKAIKLIIKEVGINGLIAIKNERIRTCHNTNFYALIKRYNDDFFIHSLIYNNLTMVKDFAQYSN